ncbi:MAG: CopG family transcriptional regulator [Candidatus Marsarchaeota archaeon]|jgi:Arc/MetJ-type ribon-helix-helix transcriptional regulator|nr:CopG family transcriptional regulator [Candidatus Marsarchaeota archaeon]
MKVKRKARKSFTTVSIPSSLFEKVSEDIKDKGFPSVSSYVAFLLRMVLSEKSTGKRSGAEKEAYLIKKRLEAMGYL